MTKHYYFFFFGWFPETWQNFLAVALFAVHFCVCCPRCRVCVTAWLSEHVHVPACVWKFISLMGPILCLPLTSVTTVPIPLNVVSCMDETNHYACGHSDSFTGNDGGYWRWHEKERASRCSLCKCHILKIALVLVTFSSKDSFFIFHYVSLTCVLV